MPCRGRRVYLAVPQQLLDPHSPLGQPAHGAPLHHVSVQPGGNSSDQSWGPVAPLAPVAPAVPMTRVAPVSPGNNVYWNMENE